MKYFVVSDIHNYCSLFKDTLKENGFDIDNDLHKVIICGDAFIYGNEPGEMYEYLKLLKEKDKLIYVFGNHDIEFRNSIKENDLKNKQNRNTSILILKYFNKYKDNLSDNEICSLCRETGIIDFIETTTIPYFEIDKYIFVHGYIPTDKNKYIANWRDLDIKSFESATRSDALKLNVRFNIKEEGKTIVGGHYSAARGYIMNGASEEDWINKKYKDVAKVPKEGFKTYKTDGLTLIDASTKKTGMINCLVIEEK